MRTEATTVKIAYWPEFSIDSITRLTLYLTNIDGLNELYLTSCIAYLSEFVQSSWTVFRPMHYLEMQQVGY